MKKKITALLFAALLLLLLPSAGNSVSAAESLSFVSINDTLPPELINCAITYGGATYLPYYAFTDYGLGISYSYFNTAATAFLYKDDLQLFFELKGGDTYDQDNTFYDGSAIINKGTVYLPLTLMCQFFDVSYSTISGSEYGTILRITSDDVILTDSEFLRAARSVMRTYYTNYNQTGSAVPAITSAPVATAAPVSSAAPQEEESHEDEQVTLSFAGAPTEDILEALSESGVNACFFFTAEEVLDAPDLVRQAIGEGHSVGVWCASDPETDYPETAALLFEAARVAVLLVAAPAALSEACRSYAETEGLVFCDCDLSTAVDADAYASAPYSAEIWLGNSSAQAVSLRLGCDADNALILRQLLSTLRSGKYELAVPRETD